MVDFRPVRLQSEKKVSVPFQISHFLNTIIRFCTASFKYNKKKVYLRNEVKKTCHWDKDLKHPSVQETVTDKKVNMFPFVPV